MDFKSIMRPTLSPRAGKLQMVYSPTDGSAAAVMDVYDFQGSGVAMTMYNTDEVSLIQLHRSLIIEHFHPVHHWIRPCVIQDGPILFSRADPSKITLIDFGITQRIKPAAPSRYDPLKESKHIVGTLHGASLNTHDGIGGWLTYVQDT